MFTHDAQDIKKLLEAADLCSSYYRYIAMYRAHDLAFLSMNGMSVEGLDYLIHYLEGLTYSMQCLLEDLDNAKKLDTKIVKLDDYRKGQ